MVQAERASVFIFIAATFFVGLFTVELYPFAAPSMFAHAPTSYTRYEIRDSDGELWDESVFGTDLKNPHDPPVRTLGRDGYGRRFPPSPAGYDVGWNEALLRQRIEPKLETWGLREVLVVGARYEVVNGRVQRVDTRSYQISSPGTDK
jgi:hypothetical protein